MCGYEHCGRRLGGFVGKGISKMRLLIHKAIAVVAYAIYLASCSSADDSVPGYENLMTFVANHRVGSDADQWIEMKNLSGSWERTGLIFGYTDDYEECQTVIAGMKAKNYAREYRSVPANKT